MLWDTLKVSFNATRWVSGRVVEVVEVNSEQLAWS